MDLKSLSSILCMYPRLFSKTIWHNYRIHPWIVEIIVKKNLTKKFKNQLYFKFTLLLIIDLLMHFKVSIWDPCQFWFFKIIKSWKLKFKKIKFSCSIKLTLMGVKSGKLNWYKLFLFILTIKISFRQISKLAKKLIATSLRSKLLNFQCQRNCFDLSLIRRNNLDLNTHFRIL